LCWTTHAVNLAKGITNDFEREQQSKCRLCNLDEVENQIHITTTCTYVELVAICNIYYKKEINSILLTFTQSKLKRNEEWIGKIIEYMSTNLWLNTPISSDIWNGRWTRHMWYDVLGSNADKPFATYDFTSFRYLLKLLTSKLFEIQSALSRHRYRLVKRLGDPMFERPTYTPGLIKKRLQDNTILDIPKVRHNKVFQKEKDNKIRTHGINKGTSKRSAKSSQRSYHGHHEHGILNSVDFAFPFKRRLDEVVTNSV
jgi:hypothetical protein